MGDRPLILVYDSRPQTGRKAEGLVVQVSGGALTRKSSVDPSTKIKSRIRENRDDTILGAGLRKSCSFFIVRPVLVFHTREIGARRSLALEKVRPDAGLFLDRIEIAKHAIGE